MGILGSRSFTCSIAVTASVTIALALPASAATIRVPADRPTLQAGIDAALPGDQVLVAPGTYTGAENKNLDFRGKAVTLASESGPDATAIDCEGSGRAIFMFRGETAATVIDGFTCRRGNGGGDTSGGGALILLAASPVIRNCVFTENTAVVSSLDRGGGAAACFGSTARFENCSFTRNTVRGSLPGALGHGGAVVTLGSAASFIDCTFAHNVTVTGEGGAIWTTPNVRDQVGDRVPARRDPWTISGCTFTDNEARAGGALLLAAGEIDGTITGCVFTGNRASTGGGAILAGAASLTDCVIAGNMAGNSGGGAILHAGAVTRSIIAGNSAEIAGGGLALYSFATVAITDCSLVSNSAPLGSSIFSNAFEARVTNSILALGGPGAAVGCDVHGPVFTCSDIYGHVGGDWVGCIDGQLGLRGNFSADPLFCDPESDLHLCGDSPCAPGSPCGLVGAWPVGCPPCGATAVTPSSWGSIKHHYRE